MIYFRSVNYLCSVYTRYMLEPQSACQALDVLEIARRASALALSRYKLPRGVEREDVAQEAALGAMQAVSGEIPHDPAQGASLETWAERCAYWAVLRMLGRERRHERHELEPQPVTGDDAETMPPAGKVETSHGASVSPTSLQERASVRREAAEAALATASPAVERAVRVYAAGGVTWRAACEAAGVSVAAVRRWRQGVGDGSAKGGAG